MSTLDSVKIARNGVEIGEYLPESIPVLLASGTLRLSDHYWKPGMSGWLLLSQLPMPQGVPPPMPRSAPPVAKPEAAKKGLIGRIAWLTGGFLMPYFFAWRIIFDRAYGFSFGTKVFYSLWTALIFCTIVIPSFFVDGRRSTSSTDDGYARRINSRVLSSADRREADEAFSKGLDYTVGKDVQRDPALAVYWYKKAAFAGHPFAQFVLANQYSTGNGVEKDLSEAYALHTVAMSGYDAKASQFAKMNRKELVKEMTDAEITKGIRRTGEIQAIIADGAGR